MSQAGLRNHLGEVTRDSVSVTNVDTDANGQVTVTFDGLRRILGGNPENVTVHASGGYVANCVSVSDNTATVEVRQGIGGTTAGELPLVTGSTDVTDLYASAVGE